MQNILEIEDELLKKIQNKINISRDIKRMKMRERNKKNKSHFQFYNKKK